MTKMTVANTNVDHDMARFSRMGEFFQLYKEYLSDSTSCRQQFRQELIVVRAKEDKQSTLTEILSMERRKTQRLSAAEIRRMNGSSRSSNGIALGVVYIDT